MVYSQIVSAAPLEAIPKVINILNKNFLLMMVSSFGIVAGFSWNDAIKSLFEKGGPFHRVKSRGLWVAALIITAIAYFATALFIRLYPDEGAPTRSSSPIRMK